MTGWIVFGIIVLLIAAILSIRITIMVSSVNSKLVTSFKILFFEKEFDFIKILEMILFPNRAVDKNKEKKKKEKPPKKKKPAASKQDEAEKGPNKYLHDIYLKDGIAGIFELVSNIAQTLSTAVVAFFRHFIINELYVDICITGQDAEDTGREYGHLIGVYYPLIGVIRNGMTVKKYEENIYADFLGIQNSHDIYFRGSIRVVHLLGLAFATVKTFLVNIINTNKEDKKVKQINNI